MLMKGAVDGMRFNIENLGFKKYCDYSDKVRAKAYVVYSIDCERALSAQEWIIVRQAILKLTLRKDRLCVNRIWKQDKTIYIIGKQSHGYGYSWDDDIIDALYTIFDSIKD